jgi:hypothetical protein
MQDSAVRTSLTIKDVHDSMDELFAIYRRYEGIISDATTTDFTPTIQVDWKAVFRTAWLPPA